MSKCLSSVPIRSKVSASTVLFGIVFVCYFIVWRTTCLLFALGLTPTSSIWWHLKDSESWSLFTLPMPHFSEISPSVVSSLDWRLLAYLPISHVEDVQYLGLSLFCSLETFPALPFPLWTEGIRVAQSTRSMANSWIVFTVSSWCSLLCSQYCYWSFLVCALLLGFLPSWGAVTTSLLYR